MPNGGFGCAYCRFYTPRKCHLRDARITNDHWTVCANVTYLDDGPTSIRQFLGYRSLDTTGVEIKGSIYSITSEDSSYTQVPWLEKSEIKSPAPGQPCFICKKQDATSKKITWKEEDFFFCSYPHYLQWRTKKIEEKEARDDITPPAVESHFSRLKVIEENTTPEQREQAQKRAKRDKFMDVLKAVIGWAFFIKIGILVYHAFFH